MPGLILLALVAALICPVIWLFAEFQERKWIRIVSGVFAIAIPAGVAFTAASVGTTLNYNAWYGGATGRLLEATVTELDNGNVERVTQVLRGLDLQYKPTYENRARYDQLVDEAIVQMHGDAPIEPDSTWNPSPFGETTWEGHWENDTGFWIVISSGIQEPRVYRSGDPPTKLHSASYSDGYRTLRFREGDQWLHTLTLAENGQAQHEWFDLQRKEMWKVDTLHKLRRPAGNARSE